MTIDVSAEGDDPFVYVDAEPTPGRSPRLAAPLATTADALERYSSRVAPAGLLAFRLRRGELDALDDLGRALGQVGEDDASEVARAYGAELARLASDPNLAAPVAAWFARFLETAAIAPEVRAGLAWGFASDPFAKGSNLDAVFASARVDDATCTRYFARPGRELGNVPVARVLAVAHAALAKGAWSPELADAVRVLGRVDRPDLRAELVAMRERAPDDDDVHELFAAALESPSDPASDDPLGWHRDREPLEAAILDPLGGRSITFDTETDVYPNGHDRLLERLAKLVSPLLDDVLFEEVPHLEDDEDGDPDQLTEAYKLRALLPDRSYEIVAGDPSDWFDVTAVVGLLNTLCRDRGSPLRFIALPTGSQEACIVAAPADAIRRALADGVLVLAETDAAAQSGRAFEAAALAELRNRRR